MKRKMPTETEIWKTATLVAREDYLELVKKLKDFQKWLTWAKDHPNRWNNSAPTRECIWEKFNEMFASSLTHEPITEKEK